MGQVKRDALKAILLPSTVVVANVAGADYICDLHRFHELVVTLDVSAAAQGGGTTLDVYITSGDGMSAWDIAHLGQVGASSAPVRYTARILADLLPQAVNSASPGVPVIDNGVLETDTPGSTQGIKTLGGQRARHGAFGDRIGYQIVFGGTPGSFTCSIRIAAAG